MAHQPASSICQNRMMADQEMLDQAFLRGLADGMHESGLDEAIEQLSDMSKPTKRM